MSRWRRQPPAYSPLTATAVCAAWRAGDPRAQLCADLRGTYSPHDVVLTDSGTSALAVALRLAARLREALPCALPAYGCFDLVSAALAADVGFTFYDLDPHTLQPDIASLRSAFNRGLSSAVIVHHHGLPVPAEELYAEATRAGALLIDDAAQGAGASVHGRPVGILGDLGVLSFSRGKGVTGGGGGALLVRDRQLIPHAEAMLAPAPVGTALAVGAKLAAQWSLSHPALYAIPANLPFLHLGKTVYRPPQPPRAMAAVGGRVLTYTRPLAGPEADARRRNATRLATALGDASAARLVPAAAGTTPGWLRRPVLGRRTEGVIRSGAPWGCVPGYPLALPDLPAARARHATTTPKATTGADELVQRLWTVPVHSRLTEADLQRIAEWIRALVA